MAPTLTTRASVAIATRLRAGEAFDTHGALAGAPGSAPAFGYLPREFHADVMLATYVVMSYGTPIAWRNEDGTWSQPLTKYSVTTSKHQGTVRRAIDAL